MKIPIGMTEITQLAGCVLLRFEDGLKKLRDGVQQHEFAEVEASSEFCGDEADARWGAEAEAAPYCFDVEGVSLRR